MRLSPKTRTRLTCIWSSLLMHCDWVLPLTNRLGWSFTSRALRATSRRLASVSRTVRFGLKVKAVDPGAFLRLRRLLADVRTDMVSLADGTTVFRHQPSNWAERRVIDRLVRRFVAAERLLDRALLPAEDSALADLGRLRFTLGIEVPPSRFDVPVVFRMDRVPRFESDELRDVFELLAPRWTLTGDRYARLLVTTSSFYHVVRHAPRRVEFPSDASVGEFVGFGSFGEDFSAAASLDGVSLDEVVTLWSPNVGDEFFEPSIVVDTLRAV